MKKRNSLSKLPLFKVLIFIIAYFYSPKIIKAQFYVYSGDTTKTILGDFEIKHKLKVSNVLAKFVEEEVQKSSEVNDSLKRNVKF